MIKLYQLHPMFIHFPIVLLLLGLASQILSRSLNGRPWLSEAASWLLWLGALSAWIAVGLGWVAERTAPHIPPAWEVLDQHEELGYWTAGIFSALSAWRFFWPLRLTKIFTLAWIAACGVLIATARYGGQLVYEFGMGLSPR
jgi:uncharacterized membrane protein